jgi:hypothetical protein
MRTLKMKYRVHEHLLVSEAVLQRNYYMLYYRRVIEYCRTGVLFTCNYIESYCRHWSTVPLLLDRALVDLFPRKSSTHPHEVIVFYWKESITVQVHVQAAVQCLPLFISTLVDIPTANSSDRNPNPRHTKRADEKLEEKVILESA